MGGRRELDLFCLALVVTNNHHNKWFLNEIVCLHFFWERREFDWQVLLLHNLIMYLLNSLTQILHLFPTWKTHFTSIVFYVSALAP